MSFLHPEKDDNWIDSNFDPSDISIILSVQQSENADSHIFEIFGGIQIWSMYECSNVDGSIVCKIESVAISTFFR